MMRMERETGEKEKEREREGEDRYYNKGPLVLQRANGTTKRTREKREQPSLSLKLASEKPIRSLCI